MSIETILTSFSLGLLATANPCVLPLYPGFLAYLAGNQQGLNGRSRYWLGFFVLAGVLTMMLVIGALLATLSLSLGSVLSILIPIADLLLIALGAALLLDFNPFKSLRQIQSPILSNPLANAFVYGLLYGPITLPCSGPLVISIFALSFTAGEAASRLFAFTWFGIGFGLPLLALSFLSGTAQRAITRQLALHSKWVNRLGGLAIIGAGVYDLILNKDLILSLLQP